MRDASQQKFHHGAFSSVGDAQVRIAQVLQVDGARVNDDMSPFVLLQLRGGKARRDADCADFYVGERGEYELRMAGIRAKADKDLGTFALWPLNSRQAEAAQEGAGVSNIGALTVVIELRESSEQSREMLDGWRRSNTVVPMRAVPTNSPGQ